LQQKSCHINPVAENTTPGSEGDSHRPPRKEGTSIRIILW